MAITPLTHTSSTEDSKLPSISRVNRTKLEKRFKSTYLRHCYEMKPVLASRT